MFFLLPILVFPLSTFLVFVFCILVSPIVLQLYFSGKLEYKQVNSLVTSFPQIQEFIWQIQTFHQNVQIMYWKIQWLFCKSILWCQIRLPSTDKFRYSVLTKCSNSKYFWFEGDCGVIATLTWITFDISHGSTSYDIPCHSGNTCWHDTNTFGIWGTNTYKYTTQEIQFTIRFVT